MGKVKDELHLQPGIISIIGGGGKTTFLKSISKELFGHKVLTTSTHFFPFNDIFTADFTSKEQLAEALETHQRLVAAQDIGKQKLVEPSLSMDEMAEVADWVLVEADGSRHLPFKAHADYEPVIPENSNLVVQVIGAPGFGKTVAQSVHRPQIFCEIADCCEDDIVTPELLSRVINAEDLCDCLIINQAEDPAYEDIAKRLQACVDYPVFWGSIRDSNIHKA